MVSPRRDGVQLDNSVAEADFQIHIDCEKHWIWGMKETGVMTM